MTAIELKNLWHTSPFQPFHIVLAGSEKLLVPHPDFLSIAPNGRVAHIWKENGDYTAVDIMLITALEKAGNGAKRRRRR